MRFVKIPNKIFGRNLTHNGFRVYAYLLARSNALYTTIVSYELIARACSIAPKTAYTAVTELIEAGLLHKGRRFGTLGYAKNKYFVEQLPGGWFKIDFAVLISSMKSTDFVVYCFIRKCMDAKAEEAFPSLSAIAKGTGISRSRAVGAVKFLRQYTYLNHVRRHYKKTKAYRHNRYLMFRLNDKKRRMRSHKHTLQNKKLSRSIGQLSNTMIMRGEKNVKSFDVYRGSIIFTKQLIDPQLSTIKERIIYTIS